MNSATLTISAASYDFVRRGGHPEPVGRRLYLGEDGVARAFVRRLYLENPRGLRRVVAIADPMASPTVDDGELLERITRGLVGGWLRVYKRPRPMPGGEVLESETADAPAERSWFEILLVDDVTAEAIAGSKVAVTAPGEPRRDATTSSTGSVEVRPCGRGTATFEAAPDGAFIGDTLEVLGAGEATETPLRGQPFARTKGKPWSLARIVRHRVRAGDSLDSIAKANGMTWRELAKFNFGTDDPKKVNLALRDQVGCTRRTKSDKNYVFDASDEPGIIYLAKPVLIGGLATGETHVLRARAIDRPMRFFLFSH